MMDHIKIGLNRAATILLFASLAWLGACHEDEVADDLIRAQPQTLVLMAGQLGGAGNLDGAGSAARFDSPGGMVEDGNGNVYVADTGNNAIRKVTTNGTVSTVVGSGASGALGDVSLKQPRDLAFSSDFTLLYVADTGNHVIRVINLDQESDAVLAGEEGVSGYLDSADGSLFKNPTGISVGDDDLYVADTGNHRIRKIGTIVHDTDTDTWTSDVTTVAGSGTAGANDAVGSTASFNAPEDLAIYSGDVLVADTGNHTIRKIKLSDNSVTTIAGLAGTAGYLDDDDFDAQFDTRFNAPSGIAVDSLANVYVADRNNHVIRELVFDDILNTWGVSTLTGIAGKSGHFDGAMTADCTDLISCGTLLHNEPDTYAQIKSPRAIAVHSSEDGLFIADSGNHTLRLAYFVDDNVSTLAGLARIDGSDDGQSTTASFNTPMGLVLDSDGNTYVADSLNHVIRMIDASGAVSTIAGSAGDAGDTDAQSTAARFNTPSAIAIDKQGNLYVADSGNDRVRKITSNGTVSTYGENADETAASFNSPGGIAVDSNGNVYVAATGAHAIYKISASDQRAALLAGSSSGLSGSDNGTGTDARFNTPLGLAVSGSTVYVADYGNQLIRAISTDQVTTKAGSVGQAGYLDSATATSKFNGPRALAVSTDGSTIYVADSGNHAIRRVGSSVSTVVGSQSSHGIRTGTLPASLHQPMGLALAPSGNLLIASGNAVFMANLKSAQ